jgi:hypothetical protein
METNFFESTTKALEEEAEEQKAAKARLEDRRVVDKLSKTSVSTIDGEGSVEVETGGEAKRHPRNLLFKKMPIQRERQMQEAVSGPKQAGSSASEAQSADES